MARSNGSRPADPVEMVLDDQRLKGAVDLEAVLDEIGGLADSNVKVLLSKFENGKSQAIDTLIPPLDMDQLIRDLREEYGPGDYWLKFMVDNKFRTSKMFSIAAPRSTSIKPQASVGGGSDMFALMLQQSNDSRREMQSMMQMMMQESRASADRNTQMMIGLVTALSGGKTDPAALLSSVAQTMQLLKPDSTAAAAAPNMSEMLETLLKMKELMGEGGGEDPSFLSMAGKILPALIDAAKQGQAAGGAPQAALPAPAHFAAGPAPASDIPDTPGHRILALIRDDLVYCLKRGHDPETAAELIFDLLQKNGIGLNDLAPVIAELSAAGDSWPGELVRHGVILTDESQLAWFNTVTQHIGGLFTQDSAAPSPARGKGGGGKNPSGNGAAGVEGHA